LHHIAADRDYFRRSNYKKTTIVLEKQIKIEKSKNKTKIEKQQKH